MAIRHTRRRVPDVILAIRDFPSSTACAKSFSFQKVWAVIPFNLKFTKARYGMSGEIRYSGAASGWSG